MPWETLIPIRTPTLQPLSQDSGGGMSFLGGTSKSSAGDSNMQLRVENSASFFPPLGKKFCEYKGDCIFLMSSDTCR